MTGDELYALDPADFVQERDRLAKELKAAGDKDGAAAVKALRRPTATAWALNQVARTTPDDVQALLDLTRAVGEAQRSGDQLELRRLGKSRREAVSTLAGRAARLLGASGGARKDELVSTLEAASADDESAEELLGGRLTKELVPSGFGAVLGAGPLPEPPPKPQRDVEEEARREAEAEAEAARLAAAQKAADDAWAHVAALEEQLAGARRRAEELDRKAGR